MNTHTIKSHNWDTPNTDPLRIPIAEMVGKEGVAIVRYTFLGSDRREPASKERFEIRLVKQHRTYLEVQVRHGSATEDERGIKGSAKERRSVRVHCYGGGQIASIDGLLLEWDGGSIVVRCNSNNGAVPKGMEKGAGNRLIDTPPLVTHQRRSIEPLSAQQAQIPVPSVRPHRHGDY